MRSILVQTNNISELGMYGCKTEPVWAEVLWDWVGRGLVAQRRVKMPRLWVWWSFGEKGGKRGEDISPPTLKTTIIINKVGDNTQLRPIITIVFVCSLITVSVGRGLCVCGKKPLQL
jgi:hypothetical protein